MKAKNLNFAAYMHFSSCTPYAKFEFSVRDLEQVSRYAAALASKSQHAQLQSLMLWKTHSILSVSNVTFRVWEGGHYLEFEYGKAGITWNLSMGRRAFIRSLSREGGHLSGV